MAVEFEKLKFTRDWNNSSDFPTYEENEQKVRADMQALHDETKEFINETLIPSIENLAVPGTGDMLESIYDPERKRTDVFKYADEKAAGITKESLGAASAEVLQAHLDNVDNPHNITADQLGAVTKDSYGWRVIEPSKPSYVISEKESSNSSISGSLACSDEITSDGTTITLVNPVVVTYSSATNFTPLLGKFFLPSNGTTVSGTSVRYFHPDGTLSGPSGNYAIMYYREVHPIMTEPVVVGCKVSVDENAYPHNEELDGLYYEFMDKFLDAIVMPGVRIQTGSYVGTGTYHVTNPSSVTFDFVPKMVRFWDGTGESWWLEGINVITGRYTQTLIKTGMTFSWYNTTNAEYQMNTQGKTYCWIAWG